MEAAKIETKLCSNCQRQINVSNFLMHETFCLKNVRPCEICNMPIDTKIKDQHFEEYHAKETCVCGLEFEKMEIEKHKKSKCPKRQVNCKYCEIPLNFDKLDEHTIGCGTRTEKCDLCGRYIQKKDTDQHLDSNCKYPIVVEKPKVDEYREFPIIRENMRRQMPKIDTSTFYNAKTHADVRNLLQNRTTNDKRKSDDDDDSRARSNQIKFNNEAARISDVTDDVDMFPCEFCTETYPIESIFHHQAECSQNPDNGLNQTNNDINPYINHLSNLNLMNENNNDNNSIPLNLLRDTYSNISSHISNNMNLFNNNFNYNDYNEFDNEDDNDDTTNYNTTHVDITRNNNQTTVDTDDPFIPCEFCHDLFPFDAIAQHQAVCYSSMNTLDGVNINHNNNNNNNNRLNAADTNSIRTTSYESLNSNIRPAVTIPSSSIIRPLQPRVSEVNEVERKSPEKNISRITARTSNTTTVPRATTTTTTTTTTATASNASIRPHNKAIPSGHSAVANAPRHIAPSSRNSTASNTTNSSIKKTTASRKPSYTPKKD